MTLQPDILYVPYCYDGTAARKMEHRRAPVKQAQRPQVNRRRRKKTVVRIDPVAVVATAVACIMLVCMAVGMVRLNAVDTETKKYEAYLNELQQENVVLQEQYHENYDTEDVRQKALAMGMVPREQIPQVTVQVQPTAEEAAPDFWTQVGTFLAGLFA